ncbi:MAG: hypothetical protein J5779_03005 [Clostridia bacterium]|nr:hypothetical protein [Clostridia bacterium]
MKNKGLHLAKITALCIAAFAVVGILALSIYFTAAYFFKSRENRGYIEFAPGIYLDFDADTVEIDEESPTSWQLLYYANKDLNSDPVVFNTENEPAGPNAEYYVLSPEFKCGAHSTTVVARAKLEYISTIDNSEISDEDINYLFDNQTYNGVRLTFDSSWVEYEGWFYYVGNNNIQEVTSAEDLAEIAYSQNAQDIAVFEKNNDGIALVRLANRDDEEVYPDRLLSFNIVLTMEFVPAENNWLN